MSKIAKTIVALIVALYLIVGPATSVPAQACGGDVNSCPCPGC